MCFVFTLTCPESWCAREVLHRCPEMLSVCAFHGWILGMKTESFWAFFFVLFLRNLGEFCLSSSAGLWLLPLHVMHSVLERSSSLEIVKVIRNSVYAFFRPITKVSLRVIVCVCLCHPGHWMISCAFVWGGCMWPRASSVGPVKHCLGGQESEVEDWILVLWCEPGGRKHAFWDRAALEDNWWNFCVSYIK